MLILYFYCNFALSNKSINTMRKLSHIIKSLAKAISTTLAVAAITATGAVMQSCDNDSDNDFPFFPLNRPNAIVTVKPATDGTSFYMQLDDSTRITASNIKAAPYGSHEVRAFVNFRMLTQPANRRKYDVYVNWIDSILTKPMACVNNPAEAGDTQYSQDPVEILREWTVSEDGYLTIHFRTQWSPNGTPHIVNLAAPDPSRPYDLTFYHNAQGVKGGYWGDGIVAFRLDRLPDTKGKMVDLTLHWLSFSGAKSVTFKFATNQSVSHIEGLGFAQSGQFEKALR